MAKKLTDFSYGFFLYSFQNGIFSLRLYVVNDLFTFPAQGNTTNNNEVVLVEIYYMK